ncbi:MAG: hypothetical protein OEY23_24590, partial [Acidimicrobiia bacterium]|nr:hypothetical protein [Acidimicrobiia bacterium]
KIYMTMHYRGQNSKGSYLHCYDVGTKNKCSGFPNAIQLPWTIDSGTGGDGTLFLRHSVSGGNLVADAVCVIKSYGGHQCYSATNGNQVSLPSTLASKLASNPERYSDFYFEGRSYFPGEWQVSTAYCWDWATSTSCGDRNWRTDNDSPLKNSPLVSSRQTGDYGYASDGKCLVGLGHTNVWWVFDKDLKPCRDTSVELTISQCLCADGRRYWGDVSIKNVDLTSGAQFEKFNIYVKDLSGNILHSQSMIDTDGVIRLSELSLGNLTQIQLEVDVQSNSTFSAWLGEQKPTVEVRWRDNPSLVG